MRCTSIAKPFTGKNLDEFYYHTESSYSFPKKHIEIIYGQPLWKEYNKGTMENINALACLFSLKHTVMENTCVITANRYDSNDTKKQILDSVTQEDILRVVRRRFYFSAILIKKIH